MVEYFPIYLLDDGRARWPDVHRRPATGDVAAALAAAGERPVALVVPGEDVLLAEVRLPPVRQASRRRQAARYALEDRLTAPVEELHFALGKRRDDGLTPVAAVARERMDVWRDALRAYGGRADAVIPDYLCPPVPEHGAWRVWLVDGRALVRCGEWAGFACEYDLLPALYAADEARPRLDALTADTEADRDLLARLRERGAEIETASVDDPREPWARLLAGAAREPALNLCQGEYAPVTRNESWWRPLRATAALFAGWLALALFVQGLSYWQLRQEAEALHDRSEADFREAFPQVRRIRDLRVQAEEELRALRGDGAAGTLFALLQAAARAGAGKNGLRIESLQYRDGALYLSLSGENVQTVETLRAGFEAQPAARLTVESADASGGGVRIRARVERAAGA